jgi:hypothetical protein
MDRHILNVFYKVYIEWTFAALLLVMLHLLSSQEMPLYASMGISAVSIYVFSYLLQNKGRMAKPLYFLLVMPLLFIASSMAGLQIFYAAIMALIIFWRTMIYHEDASANSESVWLVLTFLIGLFLTPLASFYEGSYLKHISALLIFQLLFIFSGQFVIKWIGIELTTKKKFAADFSKLLGAGLLLVGLITFGRNIFKELFFFILQGIGWIFSMLLYPVFSLVEKPLDNGRSNELLSKLRKQQEEEPMFTNSSAGFDVEFWGPFVFALIGVLIFLYLYKKTNLFNKEEIDIAPGGYISSSSISDTAHRNGLLKKGTGTPAGQIRKEVYQLEKYAHKKDLGRFNHEAMNEWLTRIGVHYDPRMVKAYQDVRYGDVAEKGDIEWFKQEMNNIKKQVNSIYKARKEENRASITERMKNVLMNKQ